MSDWNEREATHLRIVGTLEKADGNEQPSSKTLLPCPHCGGSDAFVERADLSACYVQCNDCAAQGPTVVQESDDEEVPGEAGAMAAWNRRAAHEPLPSPTVANELAGALYAAMASVHTKPIVCDVMRRAAQYLERSATPPAGEPETESLSVGNHGEKLESRRSNHPGVTSARSQSSTRTDSKSVTATEPGAAQQADDNAERTHDSADRRSPGGNTASPSLDESNQQCSAQPPGANDAEDAAKWRALRNCTRITAMGSAGCQPGGDSFDGPTAHVTLNFWTHGVPESEPWHRDWLDVFVSKALALTPTKPTASPGTWLMDGYEAEEGFRLIVTNTGTGASACFEIDVPKDSVRAEVFRRWHSLTKGSE